MSRIQNYSFSGYPSSYDTDISSQNGDSYTERGCTDVSSSTYARFTGSQQENRTWYYKFNTSNISQFANITSVSWKAKVTVSKNKDTWTLSLSNLTTSVGDTQTPTRVSTYTTPETNGGNWNVTDLNNLRFKIVPSNNVNTNYFYGADLYINYSITWYSISTNSSVAGTSITSSASEIESGNSITLTTNASSLSNIKIIDNNNDITNNFTGSSGNYSYTISSINSDHVISVSEKSSSSNRIYHKENSWIEYKKVYKKNNSVWVEQPISTNLFDIGTIYLNNNI